MNRMTFLHPLRHKPQTRWLLLLALLLLLGFGAALAVSRPGLASERTPAGGDQYAYLPFVPYEPVVPPPDTLSLVPFADGFSTTTITDIANAGDTRLFVLEREGVIRVVLANGTINVDGTVSMNGRGYRGRSHVGACAWRCSTGYSGEFWQRRLTAS